MPTDRHIQNKQISGPDGLSFSPVVDDDSHGFRGTIVARWLAQQFEDGKLKIGSQLPSYRDIATQTEVSVGTVQQVMAGLEEKGVVRRRPRRSCVLVDLPQSLSRLGGTQSAALVKVVSDSDDTGEDAWTNAIFRSIENRLHRSGVHVLSIPIDLRARDSIEQLASQLTSNRRSLVGVVIKSVLGAEQVVERIESLDLPWLTLNPLTRHHTTNFVAAANTQGAAALGYAWAKQGLRRVVFIGQSPDCTVSGREKLLGLYEGFVDAGVPTTGIEAVAVEGITLDHGRRALRSILNRAVRSYPQAIFAAGDFLAAGAMAEAQDHGLVVPTDLAIAGSTGLPEVSLLRPSLTVLSQPMEEMGRQAANMLSELRRNGRRHLPGRRVACRWVIRDSTALPMNPSDLLERYSVKINIESSSEQLLSHQVTCE